jgi:hypothetical protein
VPHPEELDRCVPTFCSFIPAPARLFIYRLPDSLYFFLPLLDYSSTGP